EASGRGDGPAAERVDPTERGLRSAGVGLSLATGPHRQQEAAWEAATEAIVRVAAEWVSEARRAEARRHEAQHAPAPRQAAPQHAAARQQAPPSQQAGPMQQAAPTQHHAPAEGSAPRPSGSAAGSAPPEHTAPLPPQTLSPRPV